MPVPTREQLNEETDRLFRSFLPDAPERLDPNDPDQAGYVENWIAIRDGLLDDWTDAAFSEIFPGRARATLDPADQATPQLTAYWHDIRVEILEGAGQYDWRSNPPADPAAAPAGGDEVDTTGWPSLYEGDLDVDGWVETLQLALRRAGHDPEMVDGKFGWRTARAVKSFQHDRHLVEDGVVGNQTWAALMGAAPQGPGTNNGPHGGLRPAAGPAAAPPPAAADPANLAPTAPPGLQPGPYDGTDLAPIWQEGYRWGLDYPDSSLDDSTPPTPLDDKGRAVWLEGATAGQQAGRSSSGPSLVTGALFPTLRMRMPDEVLSQVTVDAGTAYLTITGALRGGQVTIQPPMSIPGLSLDEKGYRLEVRNQLEGLMSGIRISGITGVPGGPVALGTTWGQQFWTNEVRMISPTEYEYIGQATVASVQIQTPAGPAQISGQFGFSINLTITPKAPPVEEEEPWYSRAWDWVHDHAGEIIVGCVVVGVIVVTDGGGVLILGGA